MMKIYVPNKKFFFLLGKERSGVRGAHDDIILMFVLLVFDS